MFASTAAALLISGTTLAPIPKEQRINWWREARFGMFIHWGLYSVPAGIWNGKKYGGGVEWIMNFAQVPVKDYEPLQKKFNPTKFDADEWVRIAKSAGMKYIVITSKHHDGFGLWDSKLTDWDMMGTPYKKDILKELARACRAQKMRLGFYHSIMDWHHPDYSLRRSWDQRPELGKPDMDRYVKYMKGQLKELLTEYGDIATVWFDGEWEEPWNHERGKDLYDYVLSLQPKTIINNRVDKGRAGMQGMTTEDKFRGDYGTPEQEIPAKGFPGVDWESCMTMNDTWGYSSHDLNWKSDIQLINNLVETASKGGNFLLNVGPTSEGLIPGASVDRLKSMGDWLKTNGKAIYGTTAGPFAKSPVRWTQKKGTLYAFVKGDATGSMVLGRIKSKIKSVKPLDSRDAKAIKWTHNPEGELTFAFQGAAARTTPRVFEIKYDGALKVEETPITQAANGTISLTADTGDVKGESLRLEGDWLGFWSNPNASVSWKFVVKKPGKFRIVTEWAVATTGESTGTVEIGGASFKIQPKPTGGWKTFTKQTVGEVTLKAGETTLYVLPTIIKEAFCNLRSVTLEPID